MKIIEPERAVITLGHLYNSKEISAIEKRMKIQCVQSGNT